MSSTTEPVVDSDSELLLQDVAKAKGFCKYQIKSGSGSAKGDGFSATIISICITGEDETKKGKTLHLIVKQAPSSQALRDSVPIVTAFERETYMYSTVFPALHALEIEKHLQILHFAPQFYKANRSHYKEAIVLENLKENGYVMYKAISPMNEQHVGLLLTKYARFHALSLAMRDQKINEFKKLVEPLEDVLITFFLGDFLNTIVLRCTEVKEYLVSRVNKDVIQLYSKFINEIPSYLKQLLETVEECSVIQHGDCWSNNMMFKYYDKGDLTKPTDARLVDFQASRVGSPVMEFCHFFYSCSSKAVLDKLDYFMQFYHGKVSDFVSEMGSDPKKLFPHHILKEHWKKYARYGLIVAATAMYAALTEEEKAVDLAELAESEGNISNALNYKIKHVDEYNKRMENLILHFYEHNLL
ncbi:hypothetical protein ILUMI_01583 [Ignelater luminosus]|uniref:CHK kinase-like domain-containing protein n=1 Tax=Ignelater luminosus TaxID=2038154 RepID=A0A8K0DQE3_IGNLU|nr:hypothetical protein ILUMI_01583 [Ignelater luminosus]